MLHSVLWSLLSFTVMGPLSLLDRNADQQLLQEPQRCGSAFLQVSSRARRGHDGCRHRRTHCPNFCRLPASIRNVHLPIRKARVVTLSYLATLAYHRFHGLMLHDSCSGSTPLLCFSLFCFVLLRTGGSEEAPIFSTCHQLRRCLH